MKLWQWITITTALVVVSLILFIRQAVTVTAKLDFFNTIFGKSGNIIMFIDIVSKLPFRVTVKNLTVDVKVNGTIYYSFTSLTDVIITNGNNSIQANFKEVTTMNVLNIANLLTGSKSVRVRGTVFGFIKLDREDKI